MKKIIFFLLSILNVAIISAQEQCLTTAPEPPQWIFNKSTRSLLTSTSYSMNIFVHIVRSSSGQGFGTGILSTIVNSLNSNFQDADIQFSLLGSEFIDNDYYYVNFSGKENQLFGINAHCNAIDIYVLGQSTSWNGAGLVEDIPSTALIVHGNYYNTSTLPHEMGHCLGLYHTHHGTVNEGGGDINQCPELVDGSNSIICGDYISDTPADPNQWSSSSCTYIGTGTDANGDQYSPDASNLMTYAYKPCRNLFSESQIGRMKDFIDNTEILQNVFYSIVSGSSVVCSSGSTFSVSNLPTVDSIIWSTGPSLTVYSGQNTNSPTIKATGSGSSWVSARLVTACGSVTLPQKTVWAGVRASFTGPTYISYEGTGTYTAEQSCGYYEWYLQEEGTSGGILVETGNPLTLRSVPRSGKVVAMEDPITRKPPPVGRTIYYLWVKVIASGLGIATSAQQQIIAYGDVDLVPEDIMLASMEESQKSGIEIFPNPTTGETTLTIQTSQENEMVEADLEWELEIYTQSQLLKEKKTRLKGSSTVVNTSGWREGVYIIRVKYKDEILTGKLVVKQ